MYARYVTNPVSDYVYNLPEGAHLSGNNVLHRNTYKQQQNEQNMYMLRISVYGYRVSLIHAPLPVTYNSTHTIVGVFNCYTGAVPGVHPEL